jgi:hypothetical protein
MRDEISTAGRREASRDDLDELRKEAREVGILDQNEIPRRKNGRNSNNRIRQIEGTSREKM